MKILISFDLFVFNFEETKKPIKNVFVYNQQIPFVGYAIHSNVWQTAILKRIYLQVITPKITQNNAKNTPKINVNVFIE